MKEKANQAIALFLTLCLLPSVGMFLFPAAPAAANQRLSPPPRLTVEGKLNPSVLREAADYAADHMALRQELISANAALNAALFHVSSEDSVVLGRGNWLFYRETMADVQRTEPLSERRLYSAAQMLGLIREYVEARDAKLYVTIAPNKATLYPEKLPETVKAYTGESDADKLGALLNRTGVYYIDLFAPFREQEEELYYHTDSHWNTRGAALAHDTIIEAMGKKERFFTGKYHDGLPHRGDLYEMLYPAGTYLERDAAFDRAFQYEYTRRYRGPEDQRIETANAGRSGSLLMFRDSFGNSLHTFLADSFGTALFARANPYQPGLTEECGADTVLIEIVERNLDWLSERPPVLPAPVREQGALVPAGAARFTIEETADDSLPGYVLLTGRLTGEIDANSPVYVGLGGVWYEASPVGDWEAEGVPFALYVEESAVKEGAAVRYRFGGAAYEAQAAETEGADCR